MSFRTVVLSLSSLAPAPAQDILKYMGIFCHHNLGTYWHLYCELGMLNILKYTQDNLPHKVIVLVPIWLSMVLLDIHVDKKALDKYLNLGINSIT